jgi:hypothetical protein
VLSVFENRQIFAGGDAWNAESNELNQIIHHSQLGLSIGYTVYLNTAVQPYLKLKWPRNGWLLGWFVGFTAWFLRFLFIYNCIYIYNYIYIIYSYITNDILYLIPWSSYQKHHSLEWVNSPLSLSHSNESSWKITWNPWYSHEKSGQIIMFHRNLAAILGWLPVTMMPMTENSEVENSDHLRSKTPFCHHLRPWNHLRCWCEPPDVVDVSDWRSFLGILGWPAAASAKTKKELWMKKVQNKMVKIW